MSVPTQGEEFAKLIEYLRRAQESCAMLSHLAGANDDRQIARGWLMISELLKRTQHQVTMLAQGKLQ